MNGYDQWKTATPYDDDPDISVELTNLAQECETYIAVHAELSDITHAERILLQQCADTMRMAITFIEENI